MVAEKVPGGLVAAVEEPAEKGSIDFGKILANLVARLVLENSSK
jgi:hypothetical protein